MDANGFIAILNRFSNLTELSIQSCNIDGEILKNLFQEGKLGIYPIKTLNITNNKLGTQGFIALSKMLPGLAELSIQSNEIDGKVLEKELQIEDVEIFSLSRLRLLDLSQNQINEGAFFYLLKLPQLRTIEKLSLRSNKIVGINFERILKKNQIEYPDIFLDNLKVIDFSDNHFTSAEMLSTFVYRLLSLSPIHLIFGHKDFDINTYLTELLNHNGVKSITVGRDDISQHVFFTYPIRRNQSKNAKFNGFEI